MKELIETLTKSIHDYFGKKPTSPSLVLSWLGTEWYASIVKYALPFGGGKKVLWATQGEDLEVVLNELSQKFLNSTQLQRANIDKLNLLLNPPKINIDTDMLLWHLNNHKDAWYKKYEERQFI